MSQHITDHKRERDDGKRAKEYAKIDREQGDAPHPASEALQRRASEVKTGDHRLAEYTKVERGDVA